MLAYETQLIDFSVSGRGGAQLLKFFGQWLVGPLA